MAAGGPEISNRLVPENLALALHAMRMQSTPCNRLDGLLAMPAITGNRFKKNSAVHSQTDGWVSFCE